MKSSPPLSQNERCKLIELFARGYTLVKAADLLSRSPSTLYREIRRFGLSASQRSQYGTLFIAQMDQPKKCRYRKNRVSIPTWKEVKRRISKGQSPDSISGELRKYHLEKYPDAPSVQAIYDYIDKRLEVDGVDLYQNLMFKKPKKNKRSKSKNTGPIRDGVSVLQRSEKANNREEVGHWEGDLMYIGYILCLIERVSNLRRIGFLPSKDSRACGRLIERLLKKYKKDVKSITFDQGGEFARHVEIAQNLKCKIYFCHPHSPWEKGAVEQSNWMLRKFFSKGVYHTIPANKTLRKIEWMLNNHSRKILYYDNAIMVYKSRLYDSNFAAVA